MSVKYFNNGFLALEGKALLKLTDISINYSVDTDEVTSFDSNFVKEYEPSFAGWTATASGIISDDTTEPTKFSGDTKLTGSTAYNGLLLFELIKDRQTLDFVLKVDTNNYQTGKVVITSFDVTGTLGSKMTYSINLQGSGALAKAS